MKKFTAAILLSAVISSTGCASMFNGSSQQVSVRSNIEGAKLYINDAYIGQENGVTTFKKKENYVITARKDGCTETSVPASKSFDATTLLGVFIDLGIVSILMVDGIGTGAWQEFDQTSFVLDPLCKS